MKYHIMKKINKNFSFIFFLFFIFSEVDSRIVDTIEALQDKKIGKDNADIKMVEFASLTCGHCAKFHNEVFPKLKEEFIDTGKILFTYKDFPLDMPAMLAAMVTNCYKGEQFHIILNSLFRNQKKWVSAANNKEDLYKAFHQILKQYGISLEQIKVCTEENEANKNKWDFILSSRLEGQKLGVNSTPSFFLNGKKLEGSVDLQMILKYIY